MIKIRLIPQNKGLTIVVAVLTATLSVVGFMTPSAHAAVGIPSDMSGVRFDSRRICVEGYNSSIHPLAAAAQQFNLRSSGVLLLDWKPNCAAAGYPSTQWFRVALASGQNPSGLCVTSSSRNHTIDYGPLQHWDRTPIFYVWPNTSLCGDTSPAFMKHMYSQAIGLGIGLRVVDGVGWNSRVMNNTLWSWTYIPWATQPEGNRIAEIYQGVYGD